MFFVFNKLFLFLKIYLLFVFFYKNNVYITDFIIFYSRVTIF